MARPCTSGPPGSRGAQRDHVGEIQRARIVAGAIEAVAERGYGGLTVAEVIARAKVSRRTFYELFEDREECFLVAFDDALARVQEPVLAAYEAGRSWRERIAAALGVLLGVFDAQPALGRLLVVDALAAGPVALERRARVLDRLVRVVDEGRAEQRPGGRTARGRDPGSLAAEVERRPNSRTARGRDSGSLAAEVERRPNSRTARGRDPGSLVAEGVVGAVLTVLHTRLLEDSSRARRRPLSQLLGPLMSMIVLPYLGAAAADRELARPVPRAKAAGRGRGSPRANPLHGLNMRLTYRTLRVLCAVAEQPHASNRVVADGAGISDQGQMSKLLTRLQNLGLIENRGGGRLSGEPNAWLLTARGGEVVDAVHHPVRP